jgi:hypothetical protein
MLRDAGFQKWRRWGGGRMDHENDARTMLEELESRTLLWEAGSKTATDPVAGSVEKHAASISRGVIAAVRDLIAAAEAGKISEVQLRDAVIGHGHHRLIAVK